MTRLSETALLLVGHGSSRDPEGARGAVESHAAILRERSTFAQVGTAFLRGRPDPADALAELTAGTVFIVPHFMSDGYFVAERIPEVLGLAGSVTRRGGKALYYCEPPALLPGFVDIAEGRLRLAARELPVKSDRLPALLVAHGSSGDSRSADAARALAEDIRGRRAFSEVSTAFLEEAPFLRDALDELQGPLVVGGVFAADGHHAEADVRAHVATRESTAYTGALGADPAVAELIVEHCRVRLSE